MLKKFFSVLMLMVPFVSGCFRYTNEEGQRKMVVFPQRGVMLTACNFAAPLGNIDQAGVGIIMRGLRYGDCAEVPLIPANLINGERRIKLVFRGMSADGRQLLGTAEKSFSVSSRGTRSETWTIGSRKRGIERYSILNFSPDSVLTFESVIIASELFEAVE